MPWKAMAPVLASAASIETVVKEAGKAVHRHITTCRVNGKRATRDPAAQQVELCIGKIKGSRGGAGRAAKKNRIAAAVDQGHVARAAVHREGPAHVKIKTGNVERGPRRAALDRDVARIRGQSCRGDRRQRPTDGDVASVSGYVDGGPAGRGADNPGRDARGLEGDGGTLEDGRRATGGDGPTGSKSAPGWRPRRGWRHQAR